NQVPKKTAADRKRIIEEAQIPISAASMQRFTGKVFEVLVVEEISAPDRREASDGTAPPGEGLYLGRLFCQAPEVDGSTVITSDRPLTPGSMVRGKVIHSAGIDLTVQV
ncbi:MAG: 30S ribosomal protein S12 methylthiotransferase RimO, partial [Spirochaetaceae bacterium]|nr:30S ribosomal protein S12 methylthiotransferase RimO [Spirochaetaceae bacterium]